MGVRIQAFRNQLRGAVKAEILRVRAATLRGDAAAAVKRYSRRRSERATLTAKINRSIGGGGQVSRGVSKLHSRTAIEPSDVTLTVSGSRCPVSLRIGGS